MKKKTFPMLLATAMVLGACSNEDSFFNPDAGKNIIELGSVGEKEVTRTGFTVAETKLMIHYVSTQKPYNESTFPYHDGEGKSTLYMASMASAAVDASPTEVSVSAVTQTTGVSGTKRYWDDVHGKNSLVSLYAIAVPNKTILTNATNQAYFDGTSNNQWSKMVKEGTETTMSHDLPWVISTAQTAATITDEDITYSNNVSGGNTIGFNHSANPKAFEVATGGKGLVFKHALSRININVIKGDGFGDFSATEFNITSAKLSKMTTAGSLNASTGVWTPTTTEQDVSIIGTSVDYIPVSEKLGYTFSAQVIPDVALKNVDATMLTFIVDGNNYYIKGSEIYDALIADHAEREAYVSALKAGYNYNLTVTIKKSVIEITDAKLVDWTQIAGKEIKPSNAIALDLVAHPMEENAGTQTSIASDIYRSTVFNTGYHDEKNTLSASNVLGTPWYWPNNTTTYYLRTISPQGTTINYASPASDHIVMQGGEITSTQDYIWGAPLEEKHGGAEHNTFDYNSATGYEAYLYPAIGATKTPIHITQFHMTSKIEVQLSTSDGGDAVDLSNATVKMINHYTSGRLFLNNGYIDAAAGVQSTTGEFLSVISRTSAAADYTWRTIPQSLTGVTFVITASGNNYTVNLTDVTVYGTSNNITSWLPGKSYVYQFKITKSPIVITTAKLVDWDTITGTIKDITLEN